MPAAPLAPSSLLSARAQEVAAATAAVVAAHPEAVTARPLPFMRPVRPTVIDRGVPASGIRYEVFGPDLWAAEVAA